MPVFIPLLTRSGRACCPHLRWFTGVTACAVRKPTWYGWNYGNVCIDFNGYGKTDIPSQPRVTSTAGGSGMTNSPCGQTQWNSSFTLDLWGAWLSAEWTSSVTLLVYHNASSARTAINTVGLNLNGSVSYANHICKSGTVSTPDPVYPNCPSTLFATYTFYEDGEYSVA